MSPSPDSHGTDAPPARNVLVVDDEPTLRLGFSYALSNRSTFVESAATGRQALDKLKSSRFDIVILDLRMPDIDGLGVIETMRASGIDVPVVLCSAAVTPVAAMRSIQNKVPDFLLKPVRPADLREVIDYVLNPPDTIVSRALQAIRAGRFGEALRIVEPDASHDRSAAAWLSVLRLKENPPEDETEEPIRDQLLASSLAALAFRSTHPKP